jgi:diaminopimelate decarboxylase
VDTIAHGVWLPQLQAGDRVYVLSTGAYTLAYGSDFNGFGPPRVCTYAGGGSLVAAVAEAVHA